MSESRLEISELGTFGSSSWWVARLVLSTMIFVLYGWTIFEPYAGDALMHTMDDLQIHSFLDIFRTFYMAENPIYDEKFRLAGFHRPVFNELFLFFIKNMFGVGSIWMRAVIVLMLMGSAWVFLSLMRNMRVHIFSATVSAAWLIFTPPLFFGLYEFGLAFSHLLVFLSVLSLWTLQKYVAKEGQKFSGLWFVATLLLMILVVFTKESAVVWPVVCVLLAIFFLRGDRPSPGQDALPLIKQINNLFRALYFFRWLVFSSIAIISIYFFTRYIKLGSFTAIAGGIEQTPSLSDAVSKFGGYALLALQIPSQLFPEYMLQSLYGLGWLEIFVRTFLFISALWVLWESWRKSRGSTLILFGAFVFAFLPIIKVSRNAPYYGDLMAIPLAMAIGLGFEAVREKISYFAYVVLSLLVVAFLFMAGALFAAGYVYNTNMWLARSQGFARSAMADLSSAEGISEATQIVGTSGMFSSDQDWALNYNSKRSFGAGFIANLRMPREKFILNSEKLLYNHQVMFVDFYPDMNPRKVGVYNLPGYGRLTSAYFPFGFAIDKLKIGNDGVYPIKGHKVVRIECDKQFQGPFKVQFNSGSGHGVLRVVDSQMNLNFLSSPFVLEFVMPHNTESMALFDEGDHCASPKVSGYLPFNSANFQYKSTINLSPRFENQLDWTGNLEKSQHGLGVVVGPGADNQNVLQQKISIKPFDRLKIVARASSIDKASALGRLQINWSDKSGKFISSFGKVIQVNHNENRFEADVVAPAGAVVGYLYVTPHSADDIIRYTEMRLLRQELLNKHE